MTEETKVTPGGCCVFHDLGLCLEDIIWGFAQRGENISAIKLIKQHGFTLKEAKDLFEKIVEKRAKPRVAKSG